MATTKEPEPTPTNACGTAKCCGRWRLPLLLAFVLAAIVVYRLANNPERQVAPNTAPMTDSASSAASTGQAVSLAIQYPDGHTRQIDAIGWHRGMTVDDAMTAASRLPDGISYNLRGDGEMAFLTKLDGVQNEGARGRNWIYSVNGAKADRSFAVYSLEPGDHILWAFAEGE